MSRRGWPFRDRRWVAPASMAGALIAWVAGSAADGFGLGDVVAGIGAAAFGALALRWTGAGQAAAAPWETRRELPETEALSPEDDVRVLLFRLCAGLDAVRLTLWAYDADEDVLRPLHSSHVAPPVVPGTGDPVRWALEEQQSIQLDRTPEWAAGPVTAASVPGGLVLTAEGGEQAPPRQAVSEAALLTGTLLGIREREQANSAQAGRFERFVAFLKTLPGSAEVERFPEELARAIAEVADADGAVVGAWQDDRGQVLASWGTGEGPAPGTYFAVGQGALARAARGNQAVERPPANRLPILAQPGERWSGVPEHLTAMPLTDSSRTVRGVVAFWGKGPGDPYAQDLIEALAPLLALQLQHSTDLVRFRRRAHEDGLTGLRNRAALDERIAEERHRFDRYRRPVSLLVLDLDHFKHTNDTWGHQAGDTVLERVSELLKNAIREVDFAARYGGEEMVVLLPETMRHEAGEVAERIRKAIGELVVDWNGQRIPVTASIGVSSCPEVVEDPGELMKSADDALYASKGAGRNRVTVAVKDTSGG